MSDHTGARIRERRDRSRESIKPANAKNNFLRKLFDKPIDLFDKHIVGNFKPIHDMYIFSQRLKYINRILSALPTSDSNKREVLVSLDRFIKSTNDHKELIEILIRQIPQQRSPQIQREIAKHCGALASEFKKKHYDIIKKDLHLKKDDNENSCTRKGIILLLGQVNTAYSKEILFEALKLEIHAHTKEDINSALDEMK